MLQTPLKLSINISLLTKALHNPLGTHSHGFSVEWEKKQTSGDGNMRTAVTFQSEVTDHKEKMRKNSSRPWLMMGSVLETWSQRGAKRGGSVLLGTFQPRDRSVRQRHERNSCFHFSWASLSQQGQVGKYSESELKSKRFGSTHSKTKGQNKFLFPGLKKKSLQTWLIRDGI